MSTEAQAVLEAAQCLSLEEQREVADCILRRLVAKAQPVSQRRTIADIAGKYHVKSDADAKAHDCGFAEAAAARFSHRS